MIEVRSATPADTESIWAILEPTLRAGETYTLPTGLTREQALAYWFSPEHRVFVATEDSAEDEPVLGTYYLRPNQRGGGSHVCNCGYMTAAASIGKGVARTMCGHSLEHARSLGFRAMQFNFVVSTNERAVRLWQSLEFEIAGRLPQAFLHPTLGYVDGLVMYRLLQGTSELSTSNPIRH